MVAYSFKPRFAQHINAGSKIFTMRNDRPRHARPDEELQLYEGMRTKHCRLIARKTCASVHDVRIVFGEKPEIYIDGAAVKIQLNRFARWDGFSNWPSLDLFWRVEHPEIFKASEPAWSGKLIAWRPIVWVGAKQ
jgi:hypothetical protein